MDTQLQPSTIFSVLGAAIFTGLLSLVGLIISKENKTSEFRQQWIDSLRSEVSDLVGYFEVIMIQSDFFAEKIKFKVGANISKEQAEYLNTIQDTIQKIHSLHRKILLRLNPVEHIDIISILSKIEAEYNSSSLLSRKKIEPLIISLVNATQTELKAGWEQVKAGEPVFQRTKKYVSVGLFLFTISVVLIAFVGAFASKTPKNVTLADKQVQSQISSCKSSPIKLKMLPNQTNVNSMKNR